MNKMKEPSCIVAISSILSLQFNVFYTLFFMQRDIDFLLDLTHIAYSWSSSPRLPFIFSSKMLFFMQLSCRLGCPITFSVLNGAYQKPLFLNYF